MRILYELENLMHILSASLMMKLNFIALSDKL